MKKIKLGPFELLNVIGKGGMGQVWRGMHLPQQIPVAIKVLNSNRVQDEDNIDAFRSEVQSIAALDHPGIVVVLDYGTIPQETAIMTNGILTEGSQYIAMELAHRGALRKFQDAIGWKELKLVLKTILSALSHAHGVGLIHRDLKPSNILIGCGGSKAGIKLTDFGLAQMIESYGGVRAGWGTPLFMAPEQFRRAWREYGPWTDLYSLGIMSFQLAAGYYPFSKKNGIGFAQAHILHNPEFFRARFGVPEGFDSWISRLIQKRPEDRFRSAAEALWALEKLGEPDEVAQKTTISMLGIGVEKDNDSTIFSMRSNETALLRSIVPKDDTLFDRIATTQLLDYSKEWNTKSYDEPFSEYEDGFDFSNAMDRRTPPIPTSWRVLNQASFPRRLKGVGFGLFGLRTLRFVGRENERDVLWERLKSVRQTRVPHCVIIEGEAGTGKSRLAQWLTQSAHEVGSARILKSRMTPLGNGGVSEMLRDHFRFVSDEFEESKQHCVQKLHSVGIKNTLRVDSLCELVGGHTPMTLEERRGIAVYYLKELSHEIPIVIWLDDAHWSLEVLDFVNTLLVASSDLPILILLTVRNDLVSQDTTVFRALEKIKEGSRATALAVDPLPFEQTAQLVRDLLFLTPTLADKVAEQCGGSPLFALQLVSDWVSKGILVYTDQGFGLKDEARTPLPKTIHHLWKERLGPLFLGHSDHSGLYIAAALGGSISSEEWGLGCQFVGVEDPTSLLRRLLEFGLAEREESGWRFCHLMFRESVVQSCKENGIWEHLNSICVHILNEGHPKRKGTFYKRYSKYQIEAGSISDALDSLLLATEYAQRIGAFDEAHGFLDTHSELSEKIGLDQTNQSVVESWVSRGKLLEEQGEYEKARTILERSQTPSIMYGWEGCYRDSELALANSHLHCGDLDKASSSFWAALRGFEKEGLVGAASCFLGLARVEEFRGDYKESLAFLEKASLSFSQEGNNLGMAKTFNAKGDVHRALGDLQSSINSLDSALELFNLVNSPMGVADCLNDQATTFRLLRKYPKALESAQSALEMYRSMNVKRTLGVQMHIAWILCYMGDHERALSIFDETGAAFRDSQQIALGAESDLLSLVALAQTKMWDVFELRLRSVGEYLDDGRWRTPEMREALEILNTLEVSHYEKEVLGLLIALGIK